MRQIIDIQLGRLLKRLEERKIRVELTDRAKDLLIDEGYDPAYGARPLKRTIQRRVLDPLALRVLAGRVPRRATWSGSTPRATGCSSPGRARGPADSHRAACQTASARAYNGAGQHDDQTPPRSNPRGRRRDGACPRDRADLPPCGTVLGVPAAAGARAGVPSSLPGGRDARLQRVQGAGARGPGRRGHDRRRDASAAR